MDFGNHRYTNEQNCILFDAAHIFFCPPPPHPKTVACNECHWPTHTAHDRRLGSRARCKCSALSSLTVTYITLFSTLPWKNRFYNIKIISKYVALWEKVSTAVFFSNKFTVEPFLREHHVERSSLQERPHYRKSKHKLFLSLIRCTKEEQMVLILLSGD